MISSSLWLVNAFIMILKPQENAEYTLGEIKRRIQELTAEFDALFEMDGSEVTEQDRFTEITLELAELKTVMQKNGIVGAGGAGFPSYAKLDSNADTVILNCCECEPLLKLHTQVLQKYAYEVLSALNEIVNSVGAKAIVAIKSSYKTVIEAVTNRVGPMV